MSSHERENRGRVDGRGEVEAGEKDEEKERAACDDDLFGASPTAVSQSRLPIEVEGGSRVGSDMSQEGHGAVRGGKMNSNKG